MFDNSTCSIARALEVVGDRWTLLVLREAFKGRACRFDTLQKTLGVATNILSSRLKILVESGVLTKDMYQEKPQRFEYNLTDKGRKLFPIIMALMAWGDEFCAPASGPTVLLIHRPCGQRTQPGVQCTACGEPLKPEELQTFYQQMAVPASVATGAKKRPAMKKKAAKPKRPLRTQAD